MALTRGLLKSFQFADEALNRFAQNLRDAIDKIVADRELQYGSPFIMATSGATIPAGRSVIIWKGSNVGTPKLFLPLANNQGQNVANMIWIANLSASNVDGYPTKPDTVTGGATVTIYNQGLTLLLSDGVSVWTVN